MARIENKYLFPKEIKEDLLKDMLPYLQHDYYSELRDDKSYTVRSIYLDTPDLTTYYEKLSGIKIRNKYRGRGYNEWTQDLNVFLEIKRKNNAYISKDRSTVLYDDLDEFLDKSDLNKIRNHSSQYERKLRAGKNFIYYLLKYKLRPVINVVYNREALECKFGSGLRVTFDMNLRSRLVQSYDLLFKDDDLDILNPHYQVLEIKHYQALPSWVPVIVNKYNLRKEAVSKYALCLEHHQKNKLLIHSI